MSRRESRLRRPVPTLGADGRGSCAARRAERRRTRTRSSVQPTIGVSVDGREGDDQRERETTTPEAHRGGSGGRVGDARGGGTGRKVAPQTRPSLLPRHPTSQLPYTLVPCCKPMPPARLQAL